MCTPHSNNPDLTVMQTTVPGLYRHYKGGWYAVMDTVRCSETLQGMTLYRALYGDCGLWVRPSVMFNEVGDFQGRVQPRFVRHHPAQVPLVDLPTAQALVSYLQAVPLPTHTAPGISLRLPPPVPETCCGRGCHGCVWENYFLALGQWRDDACQLLGLTTGDHPIPHG